MKNPTWSEWVEYRDGKLYWRKPTSVTGSGPNQPGKEAGCKHHYGYRVLNFRKKMYQVHRIIWELHNGSVPDGLTIDHINRDKLDNRIENLRLADYSVQNNNKAHPNRCAETGRWLTGAVV